jgi:predicted nucleic acid-binding protein
VGLVEQLIGLQVWIDTAPVIYFVEKHPTYLTIVRPMFRAIERGDLEAMTSTITLLEVLVHPFRMNNTPLAEKYRVILLDSGHFTTFGIFHDISEKAARLRAQHAIKTPDALQIASALVHGAKKFVTNDADLKNITEIDILVIDDFITP